MKKRLISLLPVLVLLTGCAGGDWDPNAPGISAEERQERLDYLQQLRDDREMRREKARDRRQGNI